MRKPVIVGIAVAGAAMAAVLAAGIAAANSADPVRTTPAAASTVVSQAEAERIALTVFPDGTVTETRLDTDNGRTVWNVHLSTSIGPVEVKVDATTGEVRIDDDGLPATPGATPGDDRRGHDGGDRDDDHSGPGRDGSGHDDGDGHDSSDDHGGSGRG